MKERFPGIFFSCSVCLLCLMVASCSRYYMATRLRGSNLKSYPGPEPGVEMVAYLACASDTLKITAVDEIPVTELKKRSGYEGNYSYVELLPGEHTVRLSGTTFRTSYMHDISTYTELMSGESELSFAVDPGHVYVIRSKINRQKMTQPGGSSRPILTITIKDVEIGEVVAQVESDIHDNQTVK